MEGIILVGGGHGRSGTTIMKRLLCSHPQISWVTRAETQIMEIVADLLPYVSYDCDYYLPRRSSTGYVDFRRRVLDRFGDTPEARAVLEELEVEIAGPAVYVPRFRSFPLVKPIPDAELSRLFSSFIHRLFAVSMLNPRAGYACEKTPSNAQYIIQAHSLVPTSKMIVMIRHPLDTALSFLPPEWGPNHPIEAAHYTHAYLSRWRVVSNRVPSSYYITIKLEDLIASPYTVLSETFEFLPIEAGRKIITKAAELLRQPASKREMVSAEELKRMQAILAEDIAELGYC